MPSATKLQFNLGQETGIEIARKLLLTQDLLRNGISLLRSCGDLTTFLRVVQFPLIKPSIRHMKSGPQANNPRAQQTKWNLLNDDIVACERCQRLRRYCQSVAAQKKAEFKDWNYWGLPVPNFGDPLAQLLIVGLAPAAHGGNRTGRAFTGDRSGDWLYRALFKAGFANQPTSVSGDDGLKLRNCAITNPCHCAPPENKPNAGEIANCSEWFERTLGLLPVRVIVALGQTAWTRTVDHAISVNWLQRPRPKFGFGVEVPLDNRRRTLIGCFHPSPRNTFTGKLSESMLDAVLERARSLLSQLP